MTVIKKATKQGSGVFMDIVTEIAKKAKAAAAGIAAAGTAEKNMLLREIAEALIGKQRCHNRRK